MCKTGKLCFCFTEIEISIVLKKTVSLVLLFEGRCRRRARHEIEVVYGARGNRRDTWNERGGAMGT